MSRFVLHGLCLCCLTACLDLRHVRGGQPRLEVADGHIHHRFNMENGPLTVDLEYFTKRQLTVVGLSLPLDSTKTGDLEMRIREEIQALRRLSRQQGLFRLPMVALEMGTANPQRERLDVFLTLEYFHGVFNGNPALVKSYRDMGLCAITLVDNDCDHLFSDGVLTPFGRQVIALMNKERMWIDISHLAQEQKMAVIEFSEKPVMASHTNARKVAELNYNLPDEVVAALKRKGGVVLVSFNRNGVFDSRGETADGVIRLVDHIDHFVLLLDSDHVGIGTDYQADGKYVAAPLKDAQVFERIAEELAGRGYSDDEVQNIMRSNVLKILSAGPK